MLQYLHSEKWNFKIPSTLWGLAICISPFLFQILGYRGYAVPIQHETRNANYTLVLDDYIPAMGEKLNVRFTAHYLVEPWDGESDFPKENPFEYLDVPMNRNISTVSELILEIKKKIPDVDIVVDDTDKECRVLHLIDKKLGEKAEVLEQKIDMQWTGAPSCLTEELQKREVPGIARPIGGDLREGMIADYKTKMKVDAKQKSIRNIFTHSMNLKDYNWIVWVAKTQRIESKGKWVTSVTFCGPLSR